jgi:N-methylhydantoinase A
MFEELEAKGLRQLEEDGVERDRIEFRRFIEMKYKMQIHQLEVPVPSGLLDQAGLEQVLVRFEEIYESFYGKGSAYREAGVEIGLFKVNAVGRMVRPQLPELGTAEDAPVTGSREIYWRDGGELRDTPIYSGTGLKAGFVVSGPAIIEYPETTVVVPPFAEGVVDRSGSFVIELDGKAA